MKYIAEAYAERLTHWEKFLFTMDPYDLRVGDPLLVNLLMGHVSCQGDYYKLSQSRTRKIKKIETDDRFNTVTVTVRGYGLWNRQFRILSESRVFVDAGNTRGWLER